MTGDEFMKIVLIFIVAWCLVGCDKPRDLVEYEELNHIKDKLCEMQNQISRLEYVNCVLFLSEEKYMPKLRLEASKRLKAYESLTEEQRRLFFITKPIWIDPSSQCSQQKLFCGHHKVYRDDR